MTQTAAERRFTRIAASMNSKARRLGRAGRVTANDLGWLFLKAWDGCPYCGIGLSALDCSFDHVLPFDSGGENEVANLAACCLTCQRSKAKRLAHEFAEARALVGICPIDGTRFRPRYADIKRGYGVYCSLRCAGKAGRLVRSGLTV